jgi:hypothetical protein
VSLQQCVQVEWLDRVRRAAGLDLRHLQNVVDQRQQMVAAVVDDVDLLFLIVAQVTVAFEQLGVAEDRVHRRADLVGHVGEEGALRAAGALRGFLAARSSLVRLATSASRCSWCSRSSLTSCSRSSSALI